MSEAVKNVEKNSVVFLFEGILFCFFFLESYDVEKKHIMLLPIGYNI